MKSGTLFRFHGLRFFWQVEDRGQLAAIRSSGISNVRRDPKRKRCTASPYECPQVQVVAVDARSY